MNGGVVSEALGIATRLSSELAEYLTPQPSDAEPAEAPPPLAPADEWLLEFDRRITHLDLRDATRTRFVSTHYADAVESAVKSLCESIRHKSGSSLDGDELMTTVFSPNSPKIRIPKKLQTKNEVSEQRGHMMLCQGVVAAWRNPRAHQLMDDDPDVALTMLEMIQHLMVTTESGTRTKARAPKGP